MTHERNYDEDHGEHVADWDTVALADTANPDDRGRFTFDVWCNECGQSGSFALTIMDVEVAWV